MRILLIMDPLIPVPPRHYGGIERVVADLTNELVHRGHSVTLWAAPGSQTEGSTEPFGNEGEWTRWSNARNTVVVTARFLRRFRSYDVVHNFGRLAYLTPVLSRDLPKVQTYMRKVNPQNMRRASSLGARRLHYTAVSAAIRDTATTGGDNWSVIYNCASPEKYACRTDVDPRAAPLVFLGRLERCKGAHTAIQIARHLKRQLILAGNISPLPEEREYFETQIEPAIDTGLISYVGPVDDREKNDLLGRAAALLLPIEWEEPFPVVLPEALLCGTPVIAFRRGGVPEGIDEGLTGFVCDTVEQMMTAVSRVGELDRAQCRAVAERRFSRQAIADQYERLYFRLRAS